MRPWQAAKLHGTNDPPRICNAWRPKILKADPNRKNYHLMKTIWVLCAALTTAKSRQAIKHSNGHSGRSQTQIPRRRPARRSPPHNANANNNDALSVGLTAAERVAQATGALFREEALRIEHQEATSNSSSSSPPPSPTTASHAVSAPSTGGPHTFHGTMPCPLEAAAASGTGGPSLTSNEKTWIPDVMTRAHPDGPAVLVSSFEARDAKGHIRTEGGDTFEMAFVSGPERSNPWVTDLCNGTYTIHVWLATPGTYTYLPRLQWINNEGLFDDWLASRDRAANHLGHVNSMDQKLRPWTVTVQNASILASITNGRSSLPICDTFHEPSRYVNTPFSHAPVSSAWQRAHIAPPHRFYSWGDPRHADTLTWAWKWREFGCERQSCSHEELRDHLRGKTVLFVGDSTVRLQF